ncbi:hypothetical protein SBV1_2480018 [Verrucomicrobia bacterium]|nr:hypothetical protein SBV1_2480018 [Verrucomicrobiota bacterium]
MMRITIAAQRDDAPVPIPVRSVPPASKSLPWCVWGISTLLILASLTSARAEAMLELFNIPWTQIIQKMPEIAEAGYTSLWLPPPAKASSVFSVGYDVYDAFDLGNLNQQGTVPTRWGTEAQLLQLVQVAHRFGIRVYFDNVMNHRAFSVPGFNSTTPTNFYPALIPQDFHLQTTTANGGLYANWSDVQDWCNVWDIQNESLSGLIDLATEPGASNDNFGPTLGSSILKPVFVRQPNNPEYYMITNGPSLGGAWRPFNGTTGVPVAEDVNAYLIRAAMWTLYMTKCDGFRLDAVKHVPWQFFGAHPINPQADDPSFSGYTGGIQAMYDYVHGYGSNVTGNGYFETDGNRNSVFDTEAPRNDAMLFGEHLGAPPDFQDYLNAGMRLLNQPLQNQMNTALSGNAGLQGMDGRDYTPGNESCEENGTQYSYPCFSPAQSVMFAQDQDQAGCCATHREMQNPYYFMHEGLGMIYANNYNNSSAPPGQFAFPNNPNANYLGEFGDNGMPEVCYLHHQMARGGTRPRWSDQNVVAFERYDYRDVSNTDFYDDPYATVVLFAMNDDFAYPGDILFDDGVSRTPDGYYGCNNGSPSRHYGMVVGFPPGSVLAQMATTSPGGGNGRSCAKLLVHGATTTLALAQATANDPTPANRLIYVNTTPPPGWGAIELLIPSGGWVMYGYQWPEPSRANVLTNAIILRQGGVPVPRLTVLRQDGTNGDVNFNPTYPFERRGSIGPLGNLIAGIHVTNFTYAIDIPVVTNAPFDILVCADASSSNTLVKLDGGIDLNSQMGLGPTNGTDLRDNQPGYATDVYLGYEQTAFLFRNGPEKFGARNILSNNIVSLGAETYYYTVGGSSTVVSGAGEGESITNETAAWVLHDPTNTVTSLANHPPTQRYPLNPGSTSVDVWVKVGYQFQINTLFIYYTVDGSNPEGAFGVGKGTTQTVQGSWVNHDSVQNSIDWWKGTIPAQATGTQVRYKVALFNGGSVYPNQSIPPISDAEPSGSKLYGLTETAITNFNPVNALVWLHNDLNPANTSTGLASGFHILRTHSFLPRTNAAAVYNTFIQTFYYDGQLPTGTIAYPPADGFAINTASYQVVVRGDSTVTGVTFNIQDSDPNNDDVLTGQANGNGNDTNGVPIFVSAAQVSPDPTLSQQYPNYPQEFRFNYVNVPSSGSNATINVRLNELTTSIYTNRLTALTRLVSTEAPTNVLYLSNPPTNGLTLAASSNTVYLVQACFTPTLDSSDTSLFSLYINGLLQPRANYFLRPVGSVAGCPGLRSLLYNWTNIQPGSNVLQVVFTNGVITLSDTRTVIVPGPLHISSLSGVSGGNNSQPLIVWDSAPGVNYVVLATTNLLRPFAPISTPIQATSSSTFWYDTSPPAPEKFYSIEVAP